MSDLFGATPPAAPAKRRAAAAASAAPAAPPAPAPEPPAAPAVPAAPLRGRLVTLADGRQVDTWSDDWRMECFARHLLALGPQPCNEWMFDLLQRYGEEGVAPIRAAMVAIRGY